MSLYYLVKLKMLIAHALPLSCKERSSRIYLLTVASNFTLFEYSLVDYAMWEILQERSYIQIKHLISFFSGHSVHRQTR